MAETRKIRGKLNVLLYVYSAKANKKSMNLSVSEIIYEFYITRRIHLQKSGSSNQIFLYIPHGQLTLYQIWLCWHFFSCSGPKSHWNIFSWGPLEIGPTIPNSIVHGCRKVWKSGWASWNMGAKNLGVGGVLPPLSNSLLPKLLNTGGSWLVQFQLVRSTV